MKSVSGAVEKVEVKYLPAVPEPPGDNVCKFYLEKVLELCHHLEINHLFLHADEAVYSKLMIIKWISAGRYDKVIPIIGGFHTILVQLKIIYKKYKMIGYTDWWISSDIIAAGSAPAAEEGKHYHSALRCHNMAFEALVKFKLSKDVSGVSQLLNSLIKHDTFVTFCDNFYSLTLYEENSQRYSITMNYMKDVSNLLTHIWAFRNNCYDSYMACTRSLLPQMFYYNHQNYSRYLTYHYFYVLSLSSENKAAFDDLVKFGTTACRSGQPHSRIPGDQIIEVTQNKDVKCRAGPIRLGYSTNLTSVNNWIKTSHKYAKLRDELKKYCGMRSSI